MPATAPLFPPPPIALRNVESLSITFETDEDSALEILPSVLELATPATATIGVFALPTSALGSYREANLYLSAMYEGRPCRYCAMFMVTNDQALAFGREVQGVPKKLGHVVFERTAQGVYGYAERPAGHRLLSLGLGLERAIEPQPAPSIPAVALRTIGQPDGSLAADLIETRSTWVLTSQWLGTGSIAFPEHSDVDNWEMLPVVGIRSAAYSTFDIVINRPRLLTRL
jgi:acetoacetate decarboxylase